MFFRVYLSAQNDQFCSLMFQVLRFVISRLKFCAVDCTVCSFHPGHKLFGLQPRCTQLGTMFGASNVLWTLTYLGTEIPCSHSSLPVIITRSLGLDMCSEAVKIPPEQHYVCCCLALRIHLVKQKDKRYGAWNISVQNVQRALHEVPGLKWTSTRRGRHFQISKCSTEPTHVSKYAGSLQKNQTSFHDFRKSGPNQYLLFRLFNLLYYRFTSFRCIYVQSLLCFQTYISRHL